MSGPLRVATGEPRDVGGAAGAAEEGGMLISPNSAAKILGVDKKSLARKIQLHGLPIYRGINGVQQIRLSDVRSLIASEKW